MCRVVKPRRLEQLLRRNVKRFPGGLVFKARRLLNLSTSGLRLIKKKKTLSASEREPDSHHITYSKSGSYARRTDM